MEFVSVRDFKARVSRYIRERKNVLVLRNGRPVGFFVPWKDGVADDHIRRAMLEMLGEQLRRERESRGISEEEVIADFEVFRKARLGC